MPDDEIPIEEDFAEGDDYASADPLLSIPDPVEREFRWTVKRRAFVYHLARRGNIQQAAADSGFSPLTGESLIKKQPIRDAVQVEIARQISAAAESEESVIARWATWANGDVCKIFNNDWTLKSKNEIPDETLRCIKRVKVTVTAHGRNVDVELFDAHRANNDLAQLMGLLIKGDSDASTPEETARLIRSAVQEIDELDGLSVSSAAASGNSSDQIKKRLN